MAQVHIIRHKPGAVFCGTTEVVLVARVLTDDLAKNPGLAEANVDAEWGKIIADPEVSKKKMPMAR